MKRIVTARDAHGKSVFVEIVEPGHVVRAPGIVWQELGATYADTKLPLDPGSKQAMAQR